MFLQMTHSLVAGSVQRGQIFFFLVVCGGAMMTVASRSMWNADALLCWGLCVGSEVKGKSERGRSLGVYMQGVK